MSPIFKRFFICLVIILSTLAGYAQVLLKDINPGIDGSDPIPWLVVNNKMIILAYTPATGHEYWVTDGTTNGTVLLKDINPGANDSYLSPLLVINNAFFFLADDGTHGTELWKTDGTPAGTVMVKDINPGTDPGFIGYYAELNGKLIFTANTPAYGEELWISDGTTSGTQLLKDLQPGSAASLPQNLNRSGTNLFFTAIDPAMGRVLYKTDGTSNGTVFVKEIYSSTQSALFYDFATMNNILYFYVSADSGGLWKSDGTTSGTKRLKEISVSPAIGLYTFLELNSKLYFSASDGPDFEELWVTDGTTAGTVKVKDINPGTAGSFPGEFTKYNNTIYFIADNGSAGHELWKSDGTNSGTIMIKDVNPGIDPSFPGFLSIMNGVLYFSASTNNDGYELWKSDGTPSGTVIVKDIYPGQQPGLQPPFLPSNSKLYFYATDNTNGLGFWKSDGTASGTTLIKDVYPGTDSIAYAYGELNGNIYFVASDNVNGPELWKYIPGCNPPQPGAITGNTNVNENASVTYSVSPVAGAIGYQWNLPSGWTGTSSTNSINVTVGSTSGTVQVAAIHTCGTSLFTTLSVTVQPAPLGNISWQWARTAAGNSHDEGYGVVIDASGNVYVVGNTRSATFTIGSTTLTKDISGTYDMFLAKYDPQGNLLWVKSPSKAENVYAEGIAIDSQGDIVIAGFYNGDTLDFGTSMVKNSYYYGTDIYVAKFQQNGNLVWLKGTGGNYDQQCYGLTIDENDNILISGYYSNPLTIDGTTLPTNGSNSDVFLAKLNPSGSLTWLRGGGGTNIEYQLGGLATDQQNNVFITGYFYSDVINFDGQTISNLNPGGTFDYDFFIAKYDASGTIQWLKGAQGTADEAGISLATTPDGDVYVSGTFKGDSIVFGNKTAYGDDYINSFITKYDANGNAQWAKGLNGYYNFGSLVSNPNGNEQVVFASTFSLSSFGGNSMTTEGGTLYIVRYDGNGNRIQATNTGGSFATARAYDVHMDNQGIIYVTGQYVGAQAVFGSHTITNSVQGPNEFLLAKSGNATGIFEDVKDDQLLIYPNPTSGKFNVFIPGESGNFKIEIFNLLGEKIAEGKVSEELDLSNCSKGIYLVRASKGDVVYLEKVVVE